MSGIERMSMLTARGASLAGGRGGIDRLTAQDVAAAEAMAQLGELAALLARAIGTGDLAATASLRTVWAAECIQHGRRHQWGDTTQLLWLAALTLDEAIRVPICSHCGGTGIHRNQRTCAACEGTGRAARFRPSDYAEIMRCSVGEWLGMWQPRHRERMARLELAMAEADRIERRLR